ncbi:MAG: preprotein translocase subunit SecG [Francisellaceae bacterium]|jgi:preprotein translocase subunit SecG|nr:preprotein translocase subunit SecG [Francisellaceae bacterium]MBT6538825.1 preprotein translocase subunit SecG [Francisellaceae bacterium]
MYKLILIGHVTLAFFLVGLVLIQRGKGAETGASFGGGASQTIFGSQGSISFLVKMTGVIALCFAITSVTLTKMGASQGNTGVIDLNTIQVLQQPNVEEVAIDKKVELPE